MRRWAKTPNKTRRLAHQATGALISERYYFLRILRRTTPSTLVRAPPACLPLSPRLGSPSPLLPLLCVAVMSAVVGAARPGEFALSQPPTDGITQVIFGHKSDVLLASSWDKSVRFYDTASNQLRLQVAHRAAVLDCCFDDDDRRCFSVGLEPAVSTTDLTTGTRETMGGAGHTGTVRCVVWHSGTQALFTGGWDGKLCSWDVRQNTLVASTTPQEGNKIYTIGLSGNRLIVGTSNRHVLIYDVRNLSVPEQRRESSLMNQTRVIRGFPDTTGYALGSIEGRVAVEYFNPDPNVQKNKYAFKCHRKTEGKTQILYPVNAMAFHPKFGTFATGGCDGIVNVWDGANKKRTCNYPSYPTSIAALNFNATGDKLAVAASYTHPADAIFIRSVHQHEVLPKQRQAGQQTPNTSFRPN